MKLACQEHLIPAATLSEKWKLVESLGYDGIELRGEANFALRDRLPELRAPRRAEDDRAVLIDGLAELGQHAAREGVCVLIEPLNRYEDHMINRLDQAV